MAVTPIKFHLLHGRVMNHTGGGTGVSLVQPRGNARLSTSKLGPVAVLDALAIHYPRNVPAHVRGKLDSWMGAAVSLLGRPGYA